MVSPKPLVVCLTGPTASGKSDLALEFCRRHPGVEIINGDSLCVYQRMDIGTAKPPAGVRAELPHHLFDLCTPDVNYTAGDFVRDVQATLEQVDARGKRALIVGGTGFYLKALLTSMWGAEREFRPNPQVRIRLEALETPELAARLKKCDPEAMKIITKNDRYRLIRALEIFELTGKKPSVLQSAKRPIDPRFRLFVIDRDPAELNVRIERRTRTMLEAGFLDEVKSLLTAYPNSRALSAVGYGQYWDSWNASRFIEDPGTGEIHDRGEPPPEMYTHLKTIADHNDFCCKFAWQEDRANCFGEYREPGDDTLAALKQARDERDARPYTNPHEPLSEADIALAMAEGAKQAAEQKAKSAQLAREMWDDYYKLYGHKARGESQGVVRSFPTPGFTETKTGLLVPEGTYAG
jgi:tRNA dimethylallyltransferase